jgi:TolB-like protein/Tfp pilus assembly protein PilF
MEPSLTQSPAGPKIQQGREDIFAEPDVGKELEKILSSAIFRDADSLRRFLRYTVEHTLHGEGGQLKEYRLGVEVFDRDSSFDPRLDPVVRMAARRLRSKLKDYYETEGVQDPICITVPKGSYAAAFSQRGAKELPLAVVEPSPPTRYRQLAGIGLVLLFVAIVGTLIYWFRAHQSRAAAPAQHPSLAVLPLLNLTGNPDNEYLCDGVTDELTSALSKLPGVRVVARTSAFKFKNKPEDVRSIGEQLNVASVLEGSLQKSGDRLRITVQLIRAADGYHVWSQTYDRKSSDAFAVEDEITQTIAATLRVRLVQIGQPVEEPRRIDAEARELNLRGRYWLNRRTPPELWKAIGYFNQALEKDPAFAQAYLGLAEAYSTLGANDQASPREVLPKARAAAQQALRWDESSGEAHALFAWITFLDGWNSGLAEQEFQRALQLSPNYSAAHQWYGLTLMLEQRFDESVREFNLAQDLDPLSLILSTDKGVVYYYSGQQDKAIEVAHQILAHDPDFADAHLLLGMARERQRQFKTAVQEISRYLEVSGQDPDALMKLGVVYAHAGDRASAMRMIAEMRKPTASKYVPFYYIADIYAALGDKEAAFEWLNRALDQHSNSCLLLAIDPAFLGFRSDPRFQQATRKIGLPPQAIPSSSRTGGGSSTTSSLLDSFRSADTRPKLDSL